MTALTLLEISGDGIAPYSARGLTQTLDPIDQASNLRRTVNGALKDISFEGFRKYKSTISCNDLEAPALDAVWPGLEVVVKCTKELAYKTLGGIVSPGSPGRDVVAGSSRVEGDYTYYRPQLTMKVISYTESFDEWGAVTGWQLVLEEV